MDAKRCIQSMLYMCVEAIPDSSVSAVNANRLVTSRVPVTRIGRIGDMLLF